MNALDTKKIKEKVNRYNGYSGPECIYLPVIRVIVRLLDILSLPGLIIVRLVSRPLFLVDLLLRPVR